jgi:hypothetical protein
VEWSEAQPIAIDATGMAFAFLQKHHLENEK